MTHHHPPTTRPHVGDIPTKELLACQFHTSLQFRAIREADLGVLCNDVASSDRSYELCSGHHQGLALHVDNPTHRLATESRLTTRP